MSWHEILHRINAASQLMQSSKLDLNMAGGALTSLKNVVKANVNFLMYIKLNEQRQLAQPLTNKHANVKGICDLIH